LRFLKSAFSIQKEYLEEKSEKEDARVICKEKKKKDIPFTTSGTINHS
jgi:hypothetical protein